MQVSQNFVPEGPVIPASALKEILYRWDGIIISGSFVNALS